MGGNAPVREFFVRFRSYFIYAAFFSLVINLLMLVPALFMLQVFDRVVSSRSQETLLMLAVLAGGALLFMAYLDVIRFGASLRIPGGCRAGSPGERRDGPAARTAVPVQAAPGRSRRPSPAARAVSLHIEPRVRGLH
jgi:hypothetical protein